MNIFYYSVHHILEDDEVRLFKSMGHNVFCFGVNRKTGATQGFRPSIEFNELEDFIYDDYAARGGDFNPHAELPVDFEGHFSIFIIMHEIQFIARHWHRLKYRHVIWRTIGQMIDANELVAAPMRHEGLRIVRYSPVERWANHYTGEDAVIRFYKDPLTYVNWARKFDQPLLFSNLFSQRYPEEAQVFRDVTVAVPLALGGGSNEDMPGAFGFLSFEEQVEKYKLHSSYVYMTGLDIPYTLNFIEAMMTGLPMIIFAPLSRIGKFFEVDRLVTNEVDGLVCRTPAALIDACRDMQINSEKAARLSSNGRANAIRLFGRETISREWADYLASLFS